MPQSEFADVRLVLMFCASCGESLPDDANFCPKCGIRTRRGIDAGVYPPFEELGEVFARVGQEMEKAFSIAAQEMEKAFRTAEENIRRSSSRETVVCSECGEKSPHNAMYCSKCGKKLS